MNEYTQVREEEGGNQRTIHYENNNDSTITKKSVYFKDGEGPYTITLDTYIIRNCIINITYNGRIRRIHYNTKHGNVEIDSSYIHNMRDDFIYDNDGKYRYCLRYYPNSNLIKYEELRYFKYTNIECREMKIFKNPMYIKVIKYDEEGNITNTTYDGQYVEGIDDVFIPNVPENYDDLDVYIS